MKKLIANLTCDGNKKRHSKVPFLSRVCAVRVAIRTQALNEFPHPQLDVAFGFLITNCAPSNPSL